MAQVLLARTLHNRGIDAVVESAGLGALVGRPADPLAVELMRGRGLDLGRHRARQITAEMVRSFDLVLTMDTDQQRAVESVDASVRGRVHRLGRVGGFDISIRIGRAGRLSRARSGLIERGRRGAGQGLLGAAREVLDSRSAS